MKTTIRRTLSACALVALLAACGSDDTGSEAAADSTPAETSSGDDVTTDAEPTDADAAPFPVTIEHKFGETVIEETPERVVVVGFAEHDMVLALDVIPVGVRDWYGDQPFATWPWAQDELGDAEPEVIAADALNFEQIAAMRPDVILGLSSGMSDTDYDKLAAIAPTVAQSGDYADYAQPWRERLTTTGLALGLEDKANDVLAETEELLAAAREAHPEFSGASAAVAFAFADAPGGYASTDNRSALLVDLGFEIPSEFDELAGDSFYFSLSQEDLSVLDQDVIVWIVSSEAEYEEIRSMVVRPTLNAYAEGREIVADPLLAGAFSHSSPLSLEFAIEELVPELALALDGDPATEVPSARLLADERPATDELSPEAQAASDAWSTAFDSTVDFDSKAAYIADAESLRPTIESYTEAGAAMGGIRLEPTAVFVEGDTATITYDVYFGENASYTALEGEIGLVDGTWTVGRDEFCSFMASARNACPA